MDDKIKKTIETLVERVGEKDIHCDIAMSLSQAAINITNVGLAWAAVENDNSKTS